MDQSLHHSVTGHSLLHKIRLKILKCKTVFQIMSMSLAFLVLVQTLLLMYVLSCAGTQIMCSTMIYRYVFCFLCFCLFLWLVPVVKADTSGPVAVWNRPLENLLWKYWNCISTKPLQILYESCPV